MWQYRGRVVQRRDRDAEWQQDARWVQPRNDVAEVLPYVWHGKRNRLQALTRSRIELALAADPDA